MTDIITKYSPFLNMLISLILLILALTVHEFAHAYLADKLGDPTPKVYGRLSLNPIKHIDPLGLVALIFFKFGWGKPVPIDPYNFTHPKRDEILVSLAGPFSNFILAIISSLLLKFNHFPVFVTSVLIQFIGLNIFLGVFNLLPIWPLDGSKVLLNLLPLSTSLSWQDSLQSYGYLLIFILAYSGVLPRLITLLANPLLYLLL